MQAIWLHLPVDFRVVTKISSWRVNTTSRQGIKRLGISFGSIFVLFSNKSSRGHSLSSRGKSPAPALNDNPGYGGVSKELVRYLLGRTNQNLSGLHK